jgi:thiol-disulfide isomerase/thioredoxin
MRYLILLFLYIFQLGNTASFAQNNIIKPGFIKEEYIELLKISSRQSDSLYNPDFPAPKEFEMVYRSPEMGLDNRWDLWVSNNSTAVISIRGTTIEKVSWLENFYAVMVPAKGQLKIAKDFTFNYNLCEDDKAAIHNGWLIATAFLSRDILPKIDELSKKGIYDIYIMGHSQGGAISYLLTAYLLNLQKENKISNKIVFKTYCSAAPKPGNLHFAYAYENMTKGGWSYTVVNSADWVPEAPFSIQTTTDFNPSNPFANAKKVIKKAPFFKRIGMNYVYNSLDKPTKKANKKFQNILGNSLEKFIKKSLPEYESPVYFNSSNYARTGEYIVLYADSTYYKTFPNDPEKIWTHHAFEPYLYLTTKYNTKKHDKNNIPDATIVKMELINKNKLDSIVVFDKENSWKIITTFKFKNTNIESKTLLDLTNKTYSLYSYIDGKQNELGKIYLESNSNTSIRINEDSIFESLQYSGDLAPINNFIAFTFYQQNILSETIKKMYSQIDLEKQIIEKRGFIIEKSKNLISYENIIEETLINFDSFSKNLLEKNKKYQYKNSLNGSIGNEFTFNDKNGKNISLKDFEGKYVYLDIWATWCKPCKEDYPYLEALEEHFSIENKIEIIAISIDKDSKKWLEYILKNNRKGNQLHTNPNSDFVKFYEIGALPRYILLDKKGYIINSDEIRPSNPELIKKLEAIILN